MTKREPDRYHNKAIFNRPLPSSKKPSLSKWGQVHNLSCENAWVSFAWGWKIISISKAEHLTSFWYRGPGKLGNGLLSWKKFWEQSTGQKTRKKDKTSGGSRGRARPTPYLSTKMRPERPKKIFWRPGPPPYLRVWMTAPQPPSPPPP